MLPLDITKHIFCFVSMYQIGVAVEVLVVLPTLFRFHLVPFRLGGEMIDRCVTVTTVERTPAPVRRLRSGRNDETIASVE